MNTHASPLQPRLAGKPARRRPLISLTPLIDVVFILLLFFMLASSFLEWRAITLDAPARAAAGGSLHGAILVEVRRDGLRVSGQPVEPHAVADAVRRSPSPDGDLPVLVRPASGVTLQDAVDVLDRLTAAGVARISLIRDRD